MASDITREEPSLEADERTMLVGWLDFHRATLLQKCEGLTGEQLATASIPPSELTLLGLLRHMTSVEWWWFDHIFAGGDTPEPFDDSDDPDVDFHDLVPGDADTCREMFLNACERSRKIVDAAPDFDTLTVNTKRDIRQLRWVVTHMIEEYARHNGHADLLRECIDGAVGD
jgi:hypothetical protein